MFSFVQFGALEILSVFVVCTVAGVIGLFKPTAWRWLAVMASILIDRDYLHTG